MDPIPPRRLADRAVEAMRVYLGSVGRVGYRDEQRLYDRAIKAVRAVADKTSAQANDWWPVVEDEARKRGLRVAVPGKDI